MSNRRKRQTKQSEFNKYFAKLRERTDEHGVVDNIPYQVISDATGISVPYLSGMDKKEDRVPSDKFLIKLAKFFNQDVDDFHLSLGRLPADELREAVKVRKTMTKGDFITLLKGEYCGCKDKECCVKSVGEQEHRTVADS